MGQRNGSQKVGPLARVSLPGPGTLLCATRCDPIENISHPCGQMCLRDWLLQEFDPVIKPALMHNGITRITRHVENAEARSNLLGTSPKFPPVHTRHDHIREHQIDACGIVV